MEQNNTSGIYKIHNLINNKLYIGQSVNIRQRWMTHKQCLRNRKHENTYLQQSWDKYGEDAFEFKVLEYCSIDQLDERECYYINLFHTTERDYGYNLKSGGQNGGSKWTTELRQKHSEKFMGHDVSDITRERIKINHADVSGANNPMYGKRRSDAVKAAVSKANTGRESARKCRIPVFCVELNKIWVDAAAAAKELGLKSDTILKVCREERKTHGGYHWEFAQIEE